MRCMPVPGSWLSSLLTIHASTWNALTVVSRLRQVWKSCGKLVSNVASWALSLEIQGPMMLLYLEIQATQTQVQDHTLKNTASVLTILPLMYSESMFGDCVMEVFFIVGVLHVPCDGRIRSSMPSTLSLFHVPCHTMFHVWI